MINVVYGGADAFNALAYGVDQHPANTQYFQRQIESISNTLTDVGQSFFANTQQLYNQVNNSEVMRIARAAVRTAKSLFQPNQILSIFDMASMQNAPLVMQRWIMANPTVRELYHKQQIDGYSDSYVDVSPGIIGEQHYDYRRVMTGIVQDVEGTEGEEDSWKVCYYPDELHEGDKELTHDERVDILSTWSIVEMFVAAGKSDPTSPWDAKM